MAGTLSVPRRFNGPLESGHGGYSSAVIAELSRARARSRVFFVISGYLITSLLLSEYRKEGRVPSTHAGAPG